MMKRNVCWNLFLVVLAMAMPAESNEFGREKEFLGGYESVNLRRTRSDQSENEFVPPDALTSDVVDSAVLDEIGGEDLGAGAETVERKRRDRAESDFHAERAESDAIAAAAESAAAEADSVAAAVEAAEAESSNDNTNGRGRQQGVHSSRSDYDSNVMTFEENDNGDNVVVVENDPRENAHVAGGYGGQHFETGMSRSGHEASSFDVHGNAHGVTGAQVSHGTSYGSQSQTGFHGIDSSVSSSANVHFGSSDQSSSSGNAAGYADVQQPLNALLTESSDLAKEIRLVFQVLARREDYLVQEMEKLKVALQKAIQELEENNKEAKIIRKRRDNPDDSNPYKACVYINPPQVNPAPAANFAPPEALVQPPPPPEYEPGPEEPSPPGGDEIDLSSVYWLKLPENQDEGILERVHRVLTGVRDSGKDVLLIPVTKSYMSKEDVAKGFLRAVRINPAYTSSDTKQKRRRRKLRLRIRRI